MSLLLEYLRRRAGDRPEDPAIWAIDSDRRFTWADLVGEIDARERWLAERAVAGLVAIAIEDPSTFVIVALALRGRGATVVLMDGRVPNRDLQQTARRLGVPTTIRGEARGELSIELLDVTAAEQPPGTNWVKLTSGSTGDPVGVCHSDAGLALGIRQIAEGMGIVPEDRVLLPIPLSHSYGFDSGVMSMCVLGTPLLLGAGSLPATLARDVASTEATVLTLVPPLVRALGQCAWTEHRLRLVISAGGPLPADAADAFRKATGCAVRQFYGSTETGGICFEPDERRRESRGSVGLPLPGVRVELGEDHRVVVHSNANQLGRLGEPGPGTPQPVRMGDLGRIDPDGRLVLTGRVEEMLNVGGRRVSAAAIEERLRSLEGVKDAAVVGVGDPVRGDRVVAFVCASVPDAVFKDEARSMGVRDLRTVDSLPYSERGKLDRKALRSMVGAG